MIRKVKVSNGHWIKPQFLVGWKFKIQGTRFAGLQKQIPRPLMAPLTFEQVGKFCGCQNCLKIVQTIRNHYQHSLAQADSVYAADQGSVQGALEASLWQVARWEQFYPHHVTLFKLWSIFKDMNFRPLNKLVVLQSSSRTDTGVWKQFDKNFWNPRQGARFV